MNGNVVGLAFACAMASASLVSAEDWVYFEGPPVMELDMDSVDFSGEYPTMRFRVMTEMPQGSVMVEQSVSALCDQDVMRVDEAKIIDPETSRVEVMPQDTKANRMIDVSNKKGLYFELFDTLCDG